MTTFVFEDMTATDAANFTSSDTLIFSNAALLPSDVVVFSSDNGLDLTTISADGKSLVFSGAELHNASNANHIEFTSSFIAGQQTSLYVGSFGSDDVTIGNGNDGNIAYGFAGNDNIFGSNGADIIFGGAGSDSIDGGSGNDHLYGFQLTGGDPSTDGADTIVGGLGSDYIQGNAGNDVLIGDQGNASVGDADRINGGNGDDFIAANGGNDTVNGNKGNDTIFGQDGNDSLRGGQGDDSIDGGNGNDIILGDLGNDTIHGGAGYDLMTGGDGADTFTFSLGDATFVTTSTQGLAYFSDTITDFQHGTDKLELSHTLTASDLLHAQSGIVLTSVAAALTYAQQLLDAHSGTTDVAALNVGSDTYLFYNESGSGATIDSLIKLAGVDANTITSTDFI
jgi:Ca2+-binding RTX toxin-like protein